MSCQNQLHNSQENAGNGRISNTRRILEALERTGARQEKQKTTSANCLQKKGNDGQENHISSTNLNARIEVMDNLYGKYDQSNLIDNDFTDGFQFLAMKREVYVEEFQLEDGTKAYRIRGDFKGLQNSTLFSLRNLPVFGTQLAAMQCTNLLANRMHGGSLWLDKEYPIHAEDIY